MFSSLVLAFIISVVISLSTTACLFSSSLVFGSRTRSDSRAGKTTVSTYYHRLLAFPAPHVHTSPLFSPPSLFYYHVARLSKPVSISHSLSQPSYIPQTSCPITNRDLLDHIRLLRSFEEDDDKFSIFAQRPIVTTTKVVQETTFVPVSKPSLSRLQEPQDSSTDRTTESGATLSFLVIG